ncbi:hypothetical protein KBB68_00050 [Candidatus Babeliales bacterium]|nr:hypothetical protein [Candidatus Babeliales bacterium]
MKHFMFALILLIVSNCVGSNNDVVVSWLEQVQTETNQRLSCEELQQTQFNLLSSHRTVYGYSNYDMRDRVSLEDAARACCATKNSWKRVSKMNYYANERKRLSAE